MSNSPILLEQSADGVATVTLNRPDMHNAIDEMMIRDITRTFDMLGSDPFCRMLILKANGLSFCSGADMGWIQRATTTDIDSNIREATALSEMMKMLYGFPKPLIALVQGAAVGAGVGIVACCDIVVASDAASFRLSEVKLGTAPAVISPYVVRAIGTRAAQRYLLTAEPFSATDAKTLGLIHEIVPDRMMQAAGAKLVERLSAGGPKAQRTVKELMRRIDPVGIDDETIAYTIDLVANLRASPEAQEGLKAFMEKRTPNWPKR